MLFRFCITDIPLEIVNVMACKFCIRCFQLLSYNAKCLVIRERFIKLKEIQFVIPKGSAKFIYTISGQFVSIFIGTELSEFTGNAKINDQRKNKNQQGGKRSSDKGDMNFNGLAHKSPAP